ncbi:hypothetical protein DPMN_091910 [Dreissena polymorpha]|uniref:Uncharacterized protein n=1 Tax=Dreissena polymorpha TaxID=45954 RepID=A0A9D4L2F9_DREPO|nr:hypothetical protein DPMN_091906 [Dreissena polymorpha]KAH3849505.1 hypothetical protein DPMN_091908 [Dreissena polymorpha]KAH3849507.1 hypothetical protein DPMN_091910 [Dreissena polymorpha]
MAKKRTQMRQESFKKSIRLTGTIECRPWQKDDKSSGRYQPTRMPLSEDLTTLKEWLCGEMIEGTVYTMINLTEGHGREPRRLTSDISLKSQS